MYGILFVSPSHVYHLELFAFSLFDSSMTLRSILYFDLSAFLLPAFGWYLLREMLYGV